MPAYSAGNILLLMTLTTLRRSRRVLATIIILFGLIHISFVFPVITFNISMLWFIGSGFMLVFSGFLNLAVVQYCAKSLVGYLTLVSNIICLGLFILSLWVIREPQVYIGIALFFVATVILVAALVLMETRKYADDTQEDRP
ncbi:MULTISPECIES: hypothetical protein [Mucilaginibacter]|uniref:Uncharacterized protein n=2 Tax=Mucilaginibacter rubeus TaxID=2027860 RepID=A0ABX7UIA7_9SPHI|nr:MULTISPECIES: hypothetical protein [Mucilaginibacter]QTE45954.1 hypothetical protein J3L19_11575 [Mucilaginibacter rubeus]QTE52551.1 hypothetical protein J3L21_11545 [Mucilaginibacter rubeus]QTE57640.1 hypothetical protein J3L23_03220 [Mucilaginibacter rubeus]QTE62899.1 hypothetical protein J3L22_30630 [Mucilaginibacter rubeus]QTF61657.1 hypothetical protein J3L20_30265 [Mucilaginibacter rubeus]